MRVDAHQHVGMRGISWREQPFDLILLNPSYKYGCNCCVDGFYQQYLWSKGRARYRQLGVFNPRCRVSLDVEFSRQLEKGIVGMVLTPTNHGYRVWEALPVVRVVERARLPLFLSVRGLTTDDVLFLLDGLDVPLVLFHHDNGIDLTGLSKFTNVYFDTADLKEETLERLPRGKVIPGSCYPYLPDANAARKFSWASKNLLDLIQVEGPRGTSS
ncbi:hypothetical protein [Sulfodiicoccus acidiphilus]|uniref:hypothetical protein n=1 Tax=Sulfodiicoccus acidiphilus TaxID=1670455 RepID=UPI000F82D986|nr:hypothetical protein [Sulfodiicoccus acidiphilus]